MHIISYIVLLSSIVLIKPISYPKPSLSCIQLITTITKDLNLNEYLNGHWCWDYDDESGSGDDSGSGEYLPAKEYNNDYQKTCNFDCNTCKNIATEIYSVLVGTIDTDYEYDDIFRKCNEITDQVSVSTEPPPLSSEQVNDKTNLRISVYTLTGGLLTTGLVGIGLVCRPIKKSITLTPAL